MSKLVRQIDTKDHLIVSIDNYWTASSFSMFFDSLERLYLYYRLQHDLIEAYAQRENELSKSKSFNDLPEIQNLRFRFYYDIGKVLNHPSFKSSYFLTPHFPFFDLGLEVKEIRFASPGFVDLLGIGKVLEQILETVKYYLPSKEKRSQTNLIEIEKDKMILENEIRKQELLSKKIENLKMMGFDLPQIQTMIGIEYHHTDNIKNLINNGNIVDLKIAEED